MINKQNTKDAPWQILAKVFHAVLLRDNFNNDTAVANSNISRNKLLFFNSFQSLLKTYLTNRFMNADACYVYENVIMRLSRNQTFVYHVKLFRSCIMTRVKLAHFKFENVYKSKIQS